MFDSVRSFLFIAVPDKYKREFDIHINTINVSRAKITAITFVIIEILVLTASAVVRGQTLLEKPGIYYAAMYIIFLAVMAVFAFVFTYLKKNVAGNVMTIQAVGIIFTVFSLAWCAGVSLLDQMSSGQVIVYTVAIIAIAVTPFCKPVTFLMIYLSVHMAFLILLPFFHNSGHAFGNSVNSTTFLIISYAISVMRYKKFVEEFNVSKVIQQKNEELNRINRELAEANSKLEKLSRTDGLTGIFNRSVFEKALETEWDRCKRYSFSLSLIMIDIDFFKAFNDNYGHQAGDDSLRRVAKTLSDCARRSSDVVSRYGGEEFAIILPHIKKENAAEVAEQLRRSVEALEIRHQYSSVSQYLTISLGVYTLIPSDNSAAEELIRTADKALYAAKKERNHVVAV